MCACAYDLWISYGYSGYLLPDCLIVTGYTWYASFDYCLVVYHVLSKERRDYNILFHSAYSFQVMFLSINNLLSCPDCL